jgi:hypothetical protein
LGELRWEELVVQRVVAQPELDPVGEQTASVGLEEPAMGLETLPLRVVEAMLQSNMQPPVGCVGIFEI